MEPIGGPASVKNSGLSGRMKTCIHPAVRKTNNQPTLSNFEKHFKDIYAIIFHFNSDRYPEYGRILPIKKGVSHDSTGGRHYGVGL
jgi:hypothetical protein